MLVWIPISEIASVFIYILMVWKKKEKKKEQYRKKNKDNKKYKCLKGVCQV